MNLFKNIMLYFKLISFVHFTKDVIEMSLFLKIAVMQVADTANQKFSFQTAKLPLDVALPRCDMVKVENGWNWAGLIITSLLRDPLEVT